MPSELRVGQVWCSFRDGSTRVIRRIDEQDGRGFVVWSRPGTRGTVGTRCWREQWEAWANKAARVVFFSPQKTGPDVTALCAVLCPRCGVSYADSGPGEYHCLCGRTFDITE